MYDVDCHISLVPVRRPIRKLIAHLFFLREQIRVVNAFRQGVDTRFMERTNPALAAVLQRQASASLAKRLSQASSIDYADSPGAAGIGEREYQLALPETDMERLSSRSHTETAV